MATLLAINNYHYYRGGAETVFLEQNKLFSAAGWRVVPFCMHHPRNLPTAWSEYFINEIEFGSSYSLREKIVRIPKVIYSFEARRKLSRLLDATRPDVCHAHNLYNHISPSILGLLHDRGVPTVLTLHDLKIACPAYNMLASDGICERCKGGRLHNVVVHRCVKGSIGLSTVMMAEAILHRLLGSYRHHVDRFAVPSLFYINKLVEWGMPAEKFVHVPNFVDVDRVTPDYAAGETFMYVGRISREKGLATLVRAAAACGCRVDIVGTGPQLPEIKALATELNAAVRFFGYLSGDALSRAIRSARAVVLPSEWYENAPMSVLEAYSHGRPALGARIGGIPELIREGETGLLFESGSVESLSAALGRLMSATGAELERMGRAGRRWVEEAFTARLYRQRVAAIYRGLNVNVAESP